MNFSERRVVVPYMARVIFLVYTALTKMNENTNEEGITLMDRDKDKEIYESLVPEMEITTIYTGVPRSFPFIKWCQVHDKKFMHQLCDEDFEIAKTLKGLGLASVQNLRKIYKDFLVFGANGSTNGKKEILSLSADTPIEDVFIRLPHGNAFCNHCRSIGIFVLSELKAFSFDHNEIRGIGADSMARLQQVYVDAVMEYDPSPVDPSAFSDIPCINYGIKLPQILIDEDFHCIGDICRQGLPVNLFMQIRDWLKPYRVSIMDIFADKLLQLKENERYCLAMRARGQTLQEIADHFGFTRERVRQIVTKATKKLMPEILPLAESMLYPNKNFFTFDDLLQVIPDPINAEIYRLIIKSMGKSSNIVYLDFADKFLKGSPNKQRHETLLQQVAEEEIGEGLNFFDNLEQIDAQLKEKNISALDFEDFMNFLVKNGYHFYGDYVMRGRQSYAIVCADAVRKYFPHGIKLNSDKDNADLIQLRKIIDRHYGGLELPENNRSLSARMMTVLIQSGKSQYCHIDSVIYSMALFDDIYEYMQSASQSSFHYSEVFELFKGRLLSETNITSYYFLHGMLKYLFADDFDFNDRDIITKRGEAKQNADSRLNELLLSRGEPLSKKEIKSAFPGISDFVIAFSVSREGKIIPWDHNTYNHIANLDVNKEDILNLASLLKREAEKHSGYLSQSLLFEVVKTDFPEFLAKNGIKNERNLYYTTSYFLSDLYRFRKPHILSLDINIGNLSLINIVKYLLDCKDGLNCKEYLHLASRLDWASGTIYSIFSELEKEFIRISEDDYIPKNMLTFENGFIEKFKEIIDSLLKDRGYFAMFALFSFNEYPLCQFEWNGFLVESIINEYETGAKIIYPQIKDRRYQRGIIVDSKHPAHSFEELVAYTMRTDGNISLSESEFCEYLKQKGLIYNTIPQELYNCPEIVFKDEVFTIGRE